MTHCTSSDSYTKSMMEGRAQRRWAWSASVHLPVGRTSAGAEGTPNLRCARAHNGVVLRCERPLQQTVSWSAPPPLHSPAAARIRRPCPLQRRCRANTHDRCWAVSWLSSGVQRAVADRLDEQNINNWMYSQPLIIILSSLIREW